MALIQLDPDNLDIEVRVGVLEFYIPDEEIKDIYKDIEILKVKTKNVMVKLWGNISVEKANKLLETDKRLQKKWKKFLEKEYNKKLKKILNKIDCKNKEICPGYEDISKNS